MLVSIYITILAYTVITFQHILEAVLVHQFLKMMTSAAIGLYKLMATI